MLFLVTYFVSVVWTFTVLLAEERSPIRPEACIMPPPEGDCGGAQQNRWFFDANTGSCRRFLFQGCPGVGSTFETQEECQRVCADVAAAEDNEEPQSEVTSSAETLSTFPVDPVKSNQHNAKRTTVGPMLVRTAEAKDTATEMASPPPLLPSGIQKKSSGSAEVKAIPVELVGDQQAPNQKTTLTLLSEKVQEDVKSTSGQTKEKVQEDLKSISGQNKNFKEASTTPLMAPEKPQEPVAVNDQPIPSFQDPDNTEKIRGLATPIMATDGQQEPSPQQPPSLDADDDAGQTERSGPSADQDDDSDPEEPEVFQNPGRPTELEQEAVEDRPKEAPEEENRDEETPNENLSFETPRMPRVMPNNGEVGITSVLTTLIQSTSAKELQREFTPKFLSASRGNTGTEEVRQENIDDQDPQDEIHLKPENPHEPVVANDEPVPPDRDSDKQNQGSKGLATPMMALKSDQSTTRNREDSSLQQRKINNDLGLKETLQPETIAIQITNTVPLQSRTSGVLGVVPVTRSPDGRVHSQFDGAIREDGSSQDPTKKEHVIGKEIGRNIDVTQQIPETTAALLGSLAHPRSIELSKAHRNLASNSSERSIHFKTAAQSPSANEPPAARPFSMDRRMPQNRENPLTGGNLKIIASGNPEVRTKLNAPAVRFAQKSEQNYRRPAFCSLHKVRGHCPEQLLRWYFNPFNGSCQSFTYSGCGGNPNNFETIETCFVTCTGRNGDRRRAENSFQKDAIDPRIPSRFTEPKWLPSTAPLAERPPQQPEGLRLFLDMLRRKLPPPPPPPPPPFLRSFPFPPFHPVGPGDNVADQKVLLGDTYIEDSGKPEEQRRARQSSASSEKRFHPSAKASGSEQHEQPQQQHQQQRQQQQQQRQPIAQGSRSSGFRSAPYNLPEKVTIDSDIETLRNLFRLQPRESPVFDPLPFVRNPGTPSIQTSRRTANDNTKADKRPEMDKPHLEERHPVVQRARSRQNRQSPAIGFQRFGHFFNNDNNGRPPMSQELKNFGWIEQAILVSDVEPGRLDLPFWFDGEEMMEKPRHPLPGQTFNYRDSAGPRTDGSPPNALTLRRNSMIFETRQRPKKLQDFEMDKRLASRASYAANALLPHAMKPDRVAISLDRSRPIRQSQSQLHPSFSTSHHGFPARGKGNSETPFHVLHLTRPLVEQMAGRTGVGRVEQDSRRPNHADEDNHRSGIREDGRGAERPNVMGREKNWQEENKERPVQRRRNNNNGFKNNNGFSSSRSPPSDRLTFLQIFVDGDQFNPIDQLPHFPKPSAEENQYLSESRLSPQRSQIEAPRFQTNQNGGYFPPPPLSSPRQMSPRQRPVQISRDPMTNERDWSPASEFDGPRYNGEFVNSRSGSIESVANEDLKERRRENSIPFVCQLPLEPGSCAGYQAKWFYNRRKRSCELFYYGGCSGNGNRFNTRDECLQTCDVRSDPRSDDMDSRSLDDTFGRRPESGTSSEDVLILTSPVYGEVDEGTRDSATVKVKYPGYDHVEGRPQLLTTHVPFLPGHGKRVEQLESHDPLDAQVDGKATDRTTTTAGKSAITEFTGKDGATGESKKDEDLSKTFSTQYIAIVTALGVVGIAVVLMVILSIIRLCRRVKKSKREHCIQEVIKSHMYGDLPHVIYSESSSSADSCEKGKPDKK